MTHIYLASHETLRVWRKVWDFPEGIIFDGVSPVSYELLYGYRGDFVIHDMEKGKHLFIYMVVMPRLKHDGRVSVITYTLQGTYITPTPYKITIVNDRGLLKIPNGYSPKPRGRYRSYDPASADAARATAEKMKAGAYKFYPFYNT